LRNFLKDHLLSLLREEEVRWFQRSKRRKLLQGDDTTKYFQLIANGRQRKSRIFQLEDGDRIIKGDEYLKEYITKYYQGLFGPSKNMVFSLDENHTHDIPQVTTAENDILVSPFSEEEVKAAIFQMKHNKAPGPDGFPAEFYQVFWEVIKTNLMAFFKVFQSGKLPLYCLNFGIITMLPK